MRVLLQPSSNSHAGKHYRDTVEQGVSREVLCNYLPEIVANGQFSSKKISVWGLKASEDGRNEALFQNLAAGDVVIFGGKGRAISFGRIKGKAECIELAKRLWPLGEGREAWSMIYLIDGLRPLDAPKSRINDAAGYSSANPWHRARLLSPSASKAVMSDLGLNRHKRKTGSSIAREPEEDSHTTVVRFALGFSILNERVTRIERVTQAVSARWENQTFSSDIAMIKTEVGNLKSLLATVRMTHKQLTEAVQKSTEAVQRAETEAREANSRSTIGWMLLFVFFAYVAF